MRLQISPLESFTILEFSLAWFPLTTIDPALTTRSDAQCRNRKCKCKWTRKFQRFSHFLDIPDNASHWWNWISWDETNRPFCKCKCKWTGLREMLYCSLITSEKLWCRYPGNTAQSLGFPTRSGWNWNKERRVSSRRESRPNNRNIDLRPRFFLLKLSFGPPGELEASSSPENFISLCRRVWRSQFWEFR